MCRLKFNLISEFLPSPTLPLPQMYSYQSHSSSKGRAASSWCPGWLQGLSYLVTTEPQGLAVIRLLAAQDDCGDMERRGWWEWGGEKVILTHRPSMQ